MSGYRFFISIALLFSAIATGPGCAPAKLGGNGEVYEGRDPLTDAEPGDLDDLVANQDSDSTDPRRTRDPGWGGASESEREPAPPNMEEAIDPNSSYVCEPNTMNSLGAKRIDAKLVNGATISGTLVIEKNFTVQYGFDHQVQDMKRGTINLGAVFQVGADNFRINSILYDFVGRSARISYTDRNNQANYFADMSCRRVDAP
mgnify:CR=1 FL=1